MDNDDVDALIQELQQLNMRQTELLQELQQRNRAQSHQEHCGHDTQVQRYETGDHVIITNEIRRPLLAPQTWNRENERRATVTRVKRVLQKDRVYLTTDNGTRTWRLAENVRPLQQQTQ